MTIIDSFARQPELRWQAREVVRELDDRPHLLLRVEIAGGFFPLRDAPVFVRIVGADGQPVESWFAQASEDGTRITGYFSPRVETEGTLEFGYGNQVMGRVPQPFSAKGVERLDRARLPRDVVETDLDVHAHRVRPGS